MSRGHLCVHSRYGPVTRQPPVRWRVDGLQSVSFLSPCHPSYGVLALTPAGLSPAERASLCWTHLQSIGFPPPCHPNYRALALTPAGLSPAERASLCWTHVGSRTGAPTVGSGGKSNHFRVGPQSGSHNHVSSPRLLKRSMRISRTTLSCLLHVKGYAAYSAFAFTYIFRLRSCSSIGAFLISPLPPMSSKSLQTAGPLPSTGVTRLPRYYQPLRHPLACQPISRCCRLYGLPLLRRFLNGARRASPVA